MATRPRLNRAKAIREHCLECKGYERAAVNQCCTQSCSLWGWRRGEGSAEIHPSWTTLNRAKAIRAQCLECMGGQTHAIKSCQDRACALWEWRRGEGSPEWIMTPLRRQTRISDPESSENAKRRNTTSGRYERVSVLKTGAEPAISGNLEG
jgi:hypothetical protein